MLTVNPSSLPAGTQGTAYNQTVSASGGTGPYTFSVASGSLPAGLTLNTSTGAITGTPTGSGTSNFTIAAADSVGNVGSRAYSVPIGTNSLTLSPSSLPAGVLGVSYNQTVSASGGTAPYTYSLVLRHAACRADAQYQHRRHHRRSDRERPVEFHHQGRRQSRQCRHPRL